ncbi:MAG: NAD-dependent epimerase/dehydratase family protein [Bacteroidia bacterium]|nr:NAD-dependent epimerase/dehydratase family protein [Bacteroidia bacterium]
MKILITGGAGFIGSHLAERCLELDHEVTIIDNLSTGSLSNLSSLEKYGERFQFVFGTVEDAPLVRNLVASHDRVYHLASVVGVKRVLSEPLTTILEGLRGTDHILEAAAAYNKPTLVASTSEVYGKTLDYLDPTHAHRLSEDSVLLLGSPVRHRWIYAITKLAKEALAIAYHRQKGSPFIVVRFFNTVGPRQSPAYGMVIPNLVQAAFEGRPLPVYGSGEQKRSFLHVKDAVSAIYTLLIEPSREPWGEIFNIGNPTEISIRDLAERIIALTKSSSSIELIPYEVSYGPGFEDMQRRTPDIQKMKDWFGWQPTRSLDVILQEVISYAVSTS